MSESWQDEYQRMIDDCIARESMLTEWEQNFIDSISDQLGQGKRPTQRQIEVLENVWDKATSRG